MNNFELNAELGILDRLNDYSAELAGDDYDALQRSCGPDLDRAIDSWDENLAMAILDQTAAAMGKNLEEI